MKYKVFGVCVDYLSCDIEAESEEAALEKFDIEWACGNLQSAGADCYTTSICDEAGKETEFYRITAEPVEQKGGLC